jgi:hypothetical protein
MHQQVAPPAAAAARVSTHPPASFGVSRSVVGRRHAPPPSSSARVRIAAADAAASTGASMFIRDGVQYPSGSYFRRPDGRVYCILEVRQRSLTTITAVCRCLIPATSSGAQATFAVAAAAAAKGPSEYQRDELFAIVEGGSSNEPIGSPFYSMEPCEVVSFAEYDRRRRAGDRSERLYFTQLAWNTQTKSVQLLSADMIDTYVRPPVDARAMAPRHRSHQAEAIADAEGIRWGPGTIDQTGCRQYLSVTRGDVTFRIGSTITHAVGTEPRVTRVGIITFLGEQLDGHSIISCHWQYNPNDFPRCARAGGYDTKEVLWSDSVYNIVHGDRYGIESLVNFEMERCELLSVEDWQQRRSVGEMMERVYFVREYGEPRSVVLFSPEALADRIRRYAGPANRSQTVPVPVSLAAAAAAPTSSSSSLKQSPAQVNGAAHPGLASTAADVNGVSAGRTLKDGTQLGPASARLTTAGAPVQYYGCFARDGYTYRVGSYCRTSNGTVCRIETIYHDHQSNEDVRIICQRLLHASAIQAWKTTSDSQSLQPHTHERFWNQSRVELWDCMTAASLTTLKMQPCEVVTYAEYQRRRAAGDTNDRLYFVRHEWMPATLSLRPFDERLLVLQIDPEHASTAIPSLSSAAQSSVTGAPAAASSGHSAAASSLTVPSAAASSSSVAAAAGSLTDPLSSLHSFLMTRRLSRSTCRRSEQVFMHSQSLVWLVRLALHQSLLLLCRHQRYSHTLQLLRAHRPLPHHRQQVLSALVEIARA